MNQLGMIVYDLLQKNPTNIYCRKSKLRKPEGVSLGPQYSGSRISRNAVEDDDSDDPFARDYGDEDSEEEEAGVAAHQGSEEDQSSDDGDLSGDGLGRDSDTSGTDFSDEEEDEENIGNVDSSKLRRAGQDDGIDRAELRKLMADDQRSVAATISEGTKADAEKGRAVKTQRTTFDTLLNSRIKLQKALVSVNSLATVDRDTEDTKDVISSAESAAIKLWNNLNSLRSGLQSARTGTKRKHEDITADTPLSSIWKESKNYEAEQKPHLNSSLNFWSAKCRATTALPQARGRLNQSSTQQSLTDVLTAQLSDMPRLLARTRIPRSCAPLQAAAATRKPTITSAITSGDDSPAHLPIYDDADFYSTLLQSLISQRSSETTTSMGNLNLQPWQAAREAKTKKVVDTKASKGRKLRYTVHEKLQNFMAPENRGDWGDRQANELFGSLFGRQVGLGEVDDADMDDDENQDLAGEGLRLFAGV
jgi:protein AATF/BFR2